MVQNGIYFIQTMISHHSGRVVLDVPGGRSDNGVFIQQWGYHGGTNQQWQLTNVGDNYFTIVSVHTEKALDVPGGYPIQSLGIQQYTFHGGENQQWHFETFPAATGGVSRPEHHRIQNRASGLALDVPYGTLRWGERIQQYTPHRGWNQAWLLLPVP